MVLQSVTYCNSVVFFPSFFWLKTLGFFFLAKVTEFVCHVLSSFLFLAWPSAWSIRLCFSREEAALASGRRRVLQQKKQIDCLKSRDFLN